MTGDGPPRGSCGCSTVHALFQVRRLFPPHPQALSLGERVPRRPSLEMPARLDLVAARPMVLPLPKGICGAHADSTVSGSLSLWQCPSRCPVDRKSTRLNSSHLGISYA